MVSQIPLPTPVGTVRIGKIDGNFVINPNEEDLVENTDLTRAINQLTKEVHQRLFNGAAPPSAE